MQVIDQNQKISECQTCKIEINYTPVLIAGREFCTPNECEKCETERKENQRKIAIENSRKTRQEKWDAKCPKEYNNFVFEKTPLKLRIYVNQWDMTRKNFALLGKSGGGKTMAAIHIIKKFYFQGLDADMVSEMKFSQLLIKKYSNDPRDADESRIRLQDLKECDLLLLDDLGKAKRTEAFEQGLYDLLEHRTSWQLKTIWTSNLLEKDLHNMTSKDNRDAIARRLTDGYAITTL